MHAGASDVGLCSMQCCQGVGKIMWRHALYVLDENKLFFLLFEKGVTIS